MILFFTVITIYYNTYLQGYIDQKMPINYTANGQEVSGLCWDGQWLSCKYPWDSHCSDTGAAVGSAELAGRAASPKPAGGMHY